MGRVSPEVQMISYTKFFLFLWEGSGKNNIHLILAIVVSTDTAYQKNIIQDSGEVSKNDY